MVRFCSTPWGILKHMKYSVIVPAYNEAETVRPLYEAVRAVMTDLIESECDGSNGPQAASAQGSRLRSSFGGQVGDPRAASAESFGEPRWELIFVDDGSRDETLTRMQEVRARDPRVKIISFRRQFGQTAGWSAGFDRARGEYVVVLDADLQNDPQDIPAMLEKMRAEQLDVVSGWRKDRQDNSTLKLGSRIGNWLHRVVTGEKIHDHGCSLKIYRREALADLELYGEMHRYITALLSWKGFRVGEMVVRHRRRQHGNTKYSVRKKLKGFLDLIVVKFWIQYSARPMHFFGAIGALFILAGLLLGSVIAVIWLLRITGFADSSLPLVAVVLVLLGFQFLLTGVLADVVAHTYYAQRKVYSVRSVHGFGRGSSGLPVPNDQTPVSNDQPRSQSQ